MVISGFWNACWVEGSQTKERMKKLRTIVMFTFKTCPSFTALGSVSNNEFIGHCVEMDSGKALEVYL